LLCYINLVLLTNEGEPLYPYWDRIVTSELASHSNRGVALSVMKWIDCEELSLKNSHEQAESFWLSLWDQEGKGMAGAGRKCTCPNEQD